MGLDPPAKELVHNAALLVGMVARERTVANLEAALRAAPHGMLAMHGMRGLGKTTLARALCASMQRSFPGRTCLIELPTLDEEPSKEEAQQLSDKMAVLAAAQIGVEWTGQVRFTFSAIIAAFSPWQGTVQIPMLLLHAEPCESLQAAAYPAGDGQHPPARQLSSPAAPQGLDRQA